MRKLALLLVLLLAVVATTKAESSVQLNYYEIKLLSYHGDIVRGVDGEEEVTTLTYSVEGLVPKGGGGYDDLHDIYIGACPDDIVSPKQGRYETVDWSICNGECKTLDTYASLVVDDDRTGVSGVRWSIVEPFGIGDKAIFQVKVKNFVEPGYVNVAAWFGPFIFTNNMLEGHSCDTVSPTPTPPLPTPMPTPTPPLPAEEFDIYFPVYTNQ